MTHRHRIPSYRLHRASGQAVVTLDGRDRYLGKHGTDESRARYERLIASWLANGRRLPADSTGSYTVGDLCSDFLDWCAQEYRAADGSVSREVSNVRIALRELLRLFFDLPAAEFGPRYLLLYRQRQVQAGLARKTINQRVGIVRRAFRWASSEERVPPAIYHGLLAVQGLKRGRAGGVKESHPVEPVPWEDLEAALHHMSPTIRAMVELQLLTAGRPGEIVIARACDMDMSGSVWLYRPARHKNSWRGHERILVLGEEAQGIVRRFLRPGYQDSYLFSPSEAELARRARMRAQRKTPLWPSHLKKQAKKRRKHPRRAPRDRYDTVTYARAIRRACKRAGVPVWSPGRLRHNAATEIRKEFGLEAASAFLGHRIVETTQIYSDTNSRKALEVASSLSRLGLRRRIGSI
jgi:integrase